MIQSTARYEVGQLTWSDLCRMEPRLAMLERIVRSIPPRERTWQRWSSIKSRFSEMVGWNSLRPELGSSEAYDLTYSHLLGIFESRGGVR